ncbi:MAG: HU family DNA-binding protein [Lentisphaerae bacterium]|jgi:DNA-binding protein HU-beta|nr:HU family DNA-binding protein [Lentisphaerota bacterium]
MAKKATKTAAAAKPVAKKAAPAKKATTKAVAAAKPAAKASAAAKPAAKAAPVKKTAPKKAPVPTTKSQILATIAEKAEISKKQATAAYDALLEIAYAGAKLEKGIMLPGLGKLIKQKRAARDGRNPATGEKLRIKAKTVVKFRLAKAAKDAVL